jgi:hypothetical protein
VVADALLPVMPLPSQALRHPVTVTLAEVDPCDGLAGCDGGELGDCAAAVSPAKAMAPQVAMMCLVMNVCLLLRCVTA